MRQFVPGEIAECQCGTPLFRASADGMAIQLECRRCRAVHTVVVAAQIGLVRGTAKAPQRSGPEPGVVQTTATRSPR